MKKTLKIIVITLLSILIAYLGYEFFGYLVLAIQTPTIHSTTNSSIFLGMYIMAATYFLFLLLSVIALIVFIKKTNNKRKN